MALATIENTDTFSTEPERSLLESGMLSSREEIMFNVLVTQRGHSVSRANLMQSFEDLAPNREAQAQGVRVFMHKLGNSLVSDYLAKDETYPGHFHYLLRAKDQDTEEAKRLLKEAVERSRRNMRKVSDAAIRELLAWDDPQTKRDQAIENHFQQRGIADTSWELAANCDSVDEAFFYGKSGAPALAARIICQGCTVIDDCLEARLRDNTGMRGGMSAHERKEIVRMRKEGKPEVEVQARIQEIRAVGFLAAREAYRRDGLSAPDFAFESDIG